MANQYNLPRWWLYAMVERESSFNPNAINPQGGQGLTQFNGPHTGGIPYPYDLSQPDNNYDQWVWDMGINQPWGGGRSNPWIYMTNVSRLSDWADPYDHMRRFATVWAVPAYRLMQTRYGVSDIDGTLERMAFHWYRGLFVEYNPGESYLNLYRTYIDKHRGPVEAEDGVWVPAPSY